ncbi:MAG: maltose alpha-D-glucosyltransferase [Bradymonadaceae bacterium]
MMSQDERLWYKDAIIYEVHIRSFYDSDGDGIGDIKGLTEKLDYIEELGVTALWLLPFYPSPLKDDGYDIASYTEIHPDYGTLQDFQELLEEAHRRGLKVITELVLNHTSDQHAWFQRARHAPKGSVERDFYVWSDDPTKYAEARIIFSDTKTSNWTWDPVAGQYFWHRFYAHQPDLNFDHPPVREAMMEIVDYWMAMGIDGMRLDAITYLYEREGTNCESLPETHAFLKDLRRHIDERFNNRMLLAEANQWPEDAADYFGDNDECHMTFHFPVMPRLFMAVEMEDRYPVVDILEQTPAIHYECQWALFLRNHDELTLEMVTDEERDFMYRAFAPEIRMRVNLGIRRRLAPILRDDRRKIELMYALLLALPGTPIIYYGDELGMGDNYHLGDRDGVRTPMQWSANMNAGFSRANPQSLFLPVITDPEYHYYAINVEAQENNPTSLLAWTKRLVNIRKDHRAFARGQIEFVHGTNHKVLAFIRREGKENILCVMNLSRSAQHISLDLRACEGMWPVELWRRTEFPCIGDDSYELTLGPYGFYWFALETTRPTVHSLEEDVAQLPALEVKQDWTSVFEGRQRGHLERHLISFIRRQKWFTARRRRIESLEITERIRLRLEGEQIVFSFIEVRYLNGNTEIYVLPIGFASGRREQELRQNFPNEVIGSLFVEHENEAGIVYDALANRAFSRMLLGMLRKGWDIAGGEGSLRGDWMEAFQDVSAEEVEALDPLLVQSEQSHTSVIYGNRFVLKIFRRLERGISMDVEVGRYLLERQFPHAAPLVASLDYRRGRWEPMTVGTVHQFIPNRGDGLQWALDTLEKFYDTVSESDEFPGAPGTSTEHLLAMGEEDLREDVLSPLHEMLEGAYRLGERTADLHIVLASAPADSTFAPEPFSSGYERARYQAMRTQAVRAARLLRQSLEHLPAEYQEDAGQVLDSQDDVNARFRALVRRGIGGLRTRIHGDFHLQEVLLKDDDFVIIDFEGHPWLPIGERRIKRSPLRDVASMIRSFHHAALTALKARIEESMPGTKERWSKKWEAAALYWHAHVSANYLAGYLATAGDHEFIPTDREALTIFLDALRLEKAMQQLERELQQDPVSAGITLRSILMLLETTR